MPNIHELLIQLTLEEKAALCSGVTSWQTTPIKRLEIPSIFMADGPHGIRREIAGKKVDNISSSSIPATCFPPAVTLASSWDRELLYEVGKALAEEAKEQEVSTILGPGINIKRTPLCGRNFEYFSEDPFLTAEMAIAYINGVQNNGVGVSLKHYAANSQEYMRLSASSEVDERTLREIYLYAFEKTVKEAKPYTLMCSYNPVNGEHASQNKKLLRDILKDEWGFEGIVISDWGAVDDRVKGIEAGLHLEMPSSNGIRDKWIVDAVKEGRLSEDKLNTIVYELLEYIFKCHENMTKVKGYKADYEKNHEIARKASAEGSVLLKNDGVLPLKEFKNIAVIGALADSIRTQGTGSSKLEPRKKVSFLNALDNSNINYNYFAAYDPDTDETDEESLAHAAEVSKASDLVLLFIGLTDQYESEGFDRGTLDIPLSHTELLERVTENNKNVIVILTGGSPSIVSYENKVRAILNVYLTGEAGGEAVLDLITGKVNPCGKLAETFPVSLSSNLATRYFAKEVAEYRESIFVGYRYYDSAKKDVKYPFGHGLSYTSFNYSNLLVSPNSDNSDFSYSVSFDITNVGNMAGKEIAQVYVRSKNSTIFKAEKELKGFEKILIEPGETRTVTVCLSKEDFAFFNVNSGKWEIETGEYELMVGASSRDIHLRKNVYIQGSANNVPDYSKTTPSYYSLSNVDNISAEEFEILLGRKINEYIKPGKGEYTFNTCVNEFDATWFSRWFKKFTVRNSKILLPKNSTPAEKKMVVNGALAFPVRNLFAMSGGVVSYKSSEGILMMLNGHFFKGLGKLIKGFFGKSLPKKDIYPLD
ncbi:MAG: glycosyl hydrolase [Clostridiales bacterium]|nr:glycosyl hydrolase [Clostridiales bacterium]